MNTLWPLVFLFAFTQFVVCRDFYLGMFRRNDFLVAQDVLYKAPSSFGITTASYGRLFKCPITYFRVVDRLGVGRGPITSIVRGGLKKKFITVRIKSTYRLPISVNIYVGCENKQPSTFRTTRVTPTTLAPSNDQNADPTTTEKSAISVPPGEGSDEDNGSKNKTDNDNGNPDDAPDDDKNDGETTPEPEGEDKGEGEPEPEEPDSKK
ncbi:hypothetical protein PYW08_011960 [Mythimna loreyi]|uniref:Uncharacterized protein n=1 Tax=Mythimna loreyi TaxID=667449 RepID=A0ACC2QMV8_9NEOP|nr:hypothetical protein PYW08_011960 [Mythimna loreyi]